MKVPWGLGSLLGGLSELTNSPPWAPNTQTAWSNNQQAAWDKQPVQSNPRDVSAGWNNQADNDWNTQTRRNEWSQQSPLNDWSSQSKDWNSRSQSNDWNRQSRTNDWNRQSSSDNDWSRQSQSESDWNGQSQSNEWNKQTTLNDWNRQSQTNDWNKQSPTNDWNRRSQANDWNKQLPNGDWAKQAPTIKQSPSSDIWGAARNRQTSDWKQAQSNDWSRQSQTNDRSQTDDWNQQVHSNVLNRQQPWSDNEQRGTGQSSWQQQQRLTNQQPQQRLTNQQPQQRLTNQQQQPVTNQQSQRLSNPLQTQAQRLNPQQQQQQQQQQQRPGVQQQRLTNQQQSSRLNIPQRQRASGQQQRVSAQQARSRGFSPLYTYGSSTDKGDYRTTKYFTTVAYSKFVYSLGHPWCVEGFGDAFTMAVTQLLKSEVSVMLSNTAAGLDSNRSELLFNANDSAWEVVNRTGLYQPGLKNTSADDITIPHEIAPRNSVTWPVLLGIMSKLFDDSRLGQKLRSVTDLLCQLSDAEAAVQPLEDNVYFCFMEDLVGSLLICGESEQAVDCQEFISEYAVTKEDFPDTQCMIPTNSIYHNVINTTIKFQDPNLRLPILLVDLLKGTKSQMLPRKIPPAIVEQEALTYLALFRGLMIVSAYSRVPFLCGAEKIRAPILFPGWDLPFVITAKEEGDPIWKETGLKRDSIPIVFISQSADQPCAFVISVRGTASMFEWTADFEYGQAPFVLDGRIQAHKGFLDIMNVLAPVIDDFIKSESRRLKCTCSNTHLIFTGHSLGAGVSQLLALYFAERYGIKKCGVDVSGAFFAPPRVFNYAGSQRFRQIVNGRIVLDIGDGLSYMPCYDGNSESGWPRCSRGHMTTPGEGRDYYADNYALVEIEVDFSDQSGGKGIDAFMQSIFPSGERNRPSTLASLLSRLFEVTIPGLNQVPSLGVLGAAHVCAFACKFSQDACGPDFQWWCANCPMLL